MTLEEALERIRTRPVVDLWPTLATALDVSRGKIYSMAAEGEIELLETGRLKKAISAPWRRKLGI